MTQDATPDGFWFDGSCFTVNPCYCDRCRERFRRQRSPEIPESLEEPGWAAYQEMQRKIHREFIHETIAVVHKEAPDCPVAVNWAYSLRMPEKPDPGIAYLTGDVAKVECLFNRPAHGWSSGLTQTAGWNWTFRRLRFIKWWPSGSSCLLDLMSVWLAKRRTSAGEGTPGRGRPGSPGELWNPFVWLTAHSSWLIAVRRSAQRATN